MDAEKSRRNWYSESLARGLRVIQAFGHDHPRLRMSEVAKRTGLTRAAARRYLLTLQDLGYIASDGDTFYLRPRLLDLGFSYLSSIGVEQIIQPILRDIAEKTHASSTFGVLDHHDVVFVARAPSKGIFRLSTSIGGRAPAHATSLGQVLLAGLPPDEVDRYLSESTRIAFTKATIVEADQLRRRLQRVQADGFAIANGEQAEGVIAVALPVHSQTGDVIAAVNINMYPANSAKLRLARRHVAVLRGAVSEMEAALQAQEYFAPPKHLRVRNRTSA